MTLWEGARRTTRIHRDPPRKAPPDRRGPTDGTGSEAPRVPVPVGRRNVRSSAPWVRSPESPGTTPPRPPLLRFQGGPVAVGPDLRGLASPRAVRVPTRGDGAP